MKGWVVSGLMLLSVSSFAQSKLAKANIRPDTTIYTTAEVMPEFPGGMEKWMKYLFSVPIPKDYYQQNTQASFFIQMIIEPDGSVTHARVRRIINKAMCEAFVKHVNNSPKWKPGFIQGKTVRVLYYAPISCFMLESDE
ncbi:hypothetical protein AAFN85_23435 [Mucilaginibacter sp. CAU 1740]|uniref:hypothetical protein n=1 Tax=Mucilaginibacter sp. CAU 1740 TaxID=3140365 RepID=UPI00325A8FB4